MIIDTEQPPISTFPALKRYLELHMQPPAEPENPTEAEEQAYYDHHEVAKPEAEYQLMMEILANRGDDTLEEALVDFLVELYTRTHTYWVGVLLDREKKRQEAWKDNPPT